MTASSENTNATWTREQALADIDQCQTLEEVFDVANRALGSQRQAWGDSFEVAAASANLWTMSSFNVATAENLSIATPQTTLRSVSGEQLMAGSLDASKLLARELLQPHSTHQQLMGSVEALPQKMLEVASQHGICQPEEYGVNKEIASEILMGRIAVMATTATEAFKAIASSRTRTWEDLDPMLRPAEGPIPEQNKKPFEKLIGQMGFSRIETGPAGGMRTAESQAGIALRAYQDMADLMGAPNESVGLDGLSLSLNQMFMAPGTAAAYSGGFQTIYAQKDPGHLGHEWIHAAEHWINDRANDKDLTRALGRLKNGIDSVKPNKESMLEYEHRANSNWVAADLMERLKEDGSFLTRMVVRSGKMPPKLAWAMEDNRREFTKDPAKAGKRLAESYNRHLRKGVERMSESEGVVISKNDHCSLQRFKMIKDANARGRSLFETVARDWDLVMETRYWSRPDEILARASEPFFAQTENPALARDGQAQDEGGVLPISHERDQINQEFREFSKAFAKTMTSKLGVTGASPNPEAAMLTVQIPSLGQALAARRSKQTQAEPSPTNTQSYRGTMAGP